MGVKEASSAAVAASALTTGAGGSAPTTRRLMFRIDGADWRCMRRCTGLD
jgi:hypothetical protein